MPWFDLPLNQLREYRTDTAEPPDLDLWWRRRLDEARAAARPPTLTKFGRSADSDPSSFASTAPTAGYWIAPSGVYPVRSRYVARAWSPSFVAIDRTTASSFPCFASFGRCSPIRRPGSIDSLGI